VLLALRKVKLVIALVGLALVLELKLWCRLLIALSVLVGAPAVTTTLVHKDDKLWPLLTYVS
jgi:hypothetical protein